MIIEIHPGLETYRCDMCGCYFLLKATFDRHREAEIPHFVEDSLRKNREWENYRRQWRIDHPGRTRDSDSRTTP